MGRGASEFGEVLAGHEGGDPLLGNEPGFRPQPARESGRFLRSIYVEFLENSEIPLKRQIERLRDVLVGQKGLHEELQEIVRTAREVCLDVLERLLRHLDRELIGGARTAEFHRQLEALALARHHVEKTQESRVSGLRFAPLTKATERREAFFHLHVREAEFDFFRFRFGLQRDVERADIVVERDVVRRTNRTDEFFFSSKGVVTRIAEFEFQIVRVLDHLEDVIGRAAGFRGLVTHQTLFEVVRLADVERAPLRIDECVHAGIFREFFEERFAETALERILETKADVGDGGLLRETESGAENGT